MRKARLPGTLTKTSAPSGFLDMRNFPKSCAAACASFVSCCLRVKSKDLEAAAALTSEVICGTVYRTFTSCDCCSSKRLTSQIIATWRSGLTSGMFRLLIAAMRGRWLLSGFRMFSQTIFARHESRKSSTRTPFGFVASIRFCFF